MGLSGSGNVSDTVDDVLNHGITSFPLFVNILYQIGIEMSIDLGRVYKLLTMIPG